MRLNLPKKLTYWVSVIVAVVGFVVYLLAYLGVFGMAWLGLVGVVLLAAAFALLALALVVKGL